MLLRDEGLQSSWDGPKALTKVGGEEGHNVDNLVGGRKRLDCQEVQILVL